MSDIVAIVKCTAARACLGSVYIHTQIRVYPRAQDTDWWWRTLTPSIDTFASCLHDPTSKNSALSSFSNNFFSHIHWRMSRMQLSMVIKARASPVLTLKARDNWVSSEYACEVGKWDSKIEKKSCVWILNISGPRHEPWGTLHFNSNGCVRLLYADCNLRFPFQVRLEPGKSSTTDT